MDDLYEIACCLQIWAGQRPALIAERPPSIHDLNEVDELLLRSKKGTPHGKKKPVHPRAGPA
jgi:hypothetical protein